jgi:hypothetical protein
MTEPKQLRRMSLRDRIERLEADRLELAKAALPNHPLGGFENAYLASNALDLATAVLEGRAP